MGVSFDTRGMTDQMVALMFWNMYESAEVRFARRFFVGAEAVVDLGASLGVTGSHILDVMSTSGLLVSVEANPALGAQLAATLEAHAGGGQEVRVVNAAIAAHVGHADLSASHATWTSTLGAGGESVSVATTTLSTLLADHGIQTYCLMSDIEGMEASILWGDESALDCCQKAVFELHGEPDDVRRMMARLAELGLRIVADHGPVVACTRAT